MKEVTAILDEMGHAFTMKAVRGFAFFLIKVFKALFRRVYVNEEGVQMVRPAFRYDHLQMLRDLYRKQTPPLKLRLIAG